MNLVVHPHAFKHGLTLDQIHAAFSMSGLDSRVRRRDQGQDPPRWGVIGLDQAGRQIELVAVLLADGSAGIIHANYLTAGFAREMREAR